MQKLILSLSVLCWINIANAAPLNKFIAPPSDEPSMSQAPYVQQIPTPLQVQQQPLPNTQTIAPPERLTLKQRWEKLRLQKVQEQTRQVVNKLKTKMQTLNLQDKMQWHKKFKKKYQQAQSKGQTLATSYYKKLLEVSEQLIGQDILEGQKK